MTLHKSVTYSFNITNQSLQTAAIFQYAINWIHHFLMHPYAPSVIITLCLSSTNIKLHFEPHALCFYSQVSSSFTKKTPIVYTCQNAFPIKIIVKKPTNSHIHRHRDASTIALLPSTYNRHSREQANTLPWSLSQVFYWQIVFSLWPDGSLYIVVC